MRPARGTYQVTDALVDWMSENLLPVQQATFLYYREIFRLVEIVQAAEKGRVPKFAAQSAIRAHNQDHNSALTYENVRDLEDGFLFSDAGEWVAFTDNPNAIICGKYDEAEAALSDPPEDVSIVIVWDPSQEEAYIYRSPYIAGRSSAGTNEYGDEFAHGESRGDTPTFVLPPEIEASLHAFERGSLLQQHERRA